ncbi:HU family DNA-binding protein [Paludibacter jiangxiensis]|uniref:Nucleoid DNA-binding protein n=1 Tax=Paludibacter jiangxiensis TaxID=681398 RepID=A0A161LG62_9BACT|nr:HU family DNA-binding protein [Paludibacter jiangxiensis]GAT64345.1 nucleoid DNA-binding protein [Paludibacter jiangxiensis]
MSNEKISSLELISAISEQSGTTKKVATAFMRQLSETVEEALLRDGIVKIKGFGTYKITWNESRSSINVNTGERYEIAGHNKLTFTPDDEVSDIVNRPYAHLEPMDLDGNFTEKAAELPEEDPHMKRFSEQASEIVNLIADMQAFKPKKKAKPEPVQEPQSIEPAAEIIATPAIEPEPIKEEEPQPAASTEADVVSEPVATTTEKIEEPLQPAPEARKSETIIQETPKQKEPEPTIPSATVTEVVAKEAENHREPVASSIETEAKLIEQMASQPEKRSFKWLYISLAIIILLSGVAFAFYYYYPALFPQQPVQKAVVVKNAVKPQPTVQTPVNSPNDSVEKPKAKPVHESVKEKAPDPAPAPPKDVFETPRVYKEFITTETTSEGTWLTMLSLKYYGHKLFWVYIYEANKDKIHNPGVLPPGTKLKIPKLDPRLIDKHNGRCFRQASELQTLYTTKQ